MNEQVLQWIAEEYHTVYGYSEVDSKVYAIEDYYQITSEADVETLVQAEMPPYVAKGSHAQAK